MYRCEARSVHGFIQQLACGYVQHGHLFYNACVVSKGRDLQAVDRRMIERYSLDLSRATRSRMRKAGLATVHYLRHGRFFALLAYKQGESPFFADEPFKDIRKEPLVYGGYCVSLRPGVDRKFHPCVWIEPRRAEALSHKFVERLALTASSEQLLQEFLALPYVRYAPVRRQISKIFRVTNERRRRAGLAPVPADALRVRRQVVRPFVDRPEDIGRAADGQHPAAA